MKYIDKGYLPMAEYVTTPVDDLGHPSHCRTEMLNHVLRGNVFDINHFVLEVISENWL